MDTLYDDVLNEISHLKSSHDFSCLDGWCGYQWIQHVKETRYGQSFFYDKNFILEISKNYCFKICELIQEMKVIISKILHVNKFYQKIFNRFCLSINDDIDKLYTFIFPSKSYKDENNNEYIDPKEVVELKEQLFKMRDTLGDYRIIYYSNRVFLHYYKTDFKIVFKKNIDIEYSN